MRRLLVALAMIAASACALGEVAAPADTIGDLMRGDCLNDTRWTSSPFQVVACEHPHDWQVIAVLPYPRVTSGDEERRAGTVLLPGNPEAIASIEDTCTTEFEIAFADAGSLRMSWITDALGEFDVTEWPQPRPGDEAVACFVFDSRRRPLEGSVLPDE